VFYEVVECGERLALAGKGFVLWHIDACCIVFAVWPVLGNCHLLCKWDHHVLSHYQALYGQEGKKTGRKSQIRVGFRARCFWRQEVSKSLNKNRKCKNDHMIDDFSSNYLKQLVKEHRKSKNINKKGSEPAEQVDFLFNVVNQVIIEILFVLDTFFHCIQVMLLPENQFIFGF
jgi:hypothetical protein